MNNNKLSLDLLQKVAESKWKTLSTLTIWDKVADFIWGKVQD